MKSSLKELQDKLIKLGQTLSPTQCKEFRSILDDFASMYYDIGEAYKMAAVHLIPSKLVGDVTISTEIFDNAPATAFKPSQSLQDIAMSLARNLDNQIKKEEKK